MKKDCYTKLHLVEKFDGFSKLPPNPRKRSHLKLQPDLPPAPSASAAIERMRNQHFEQRQNQVLNTSTSAQDALLKLNKFLGEIFHADCCFTAASSSLATCWSPDRLSTHFQQKLWGWFQNPVLKEHWVNDDLTIADVQVLLPQDPFPFRSILAICTRHYGKFNGMICLMRSPAHSWKEQDLHLLKTLAPQVAIGITQAKLEQQAQQQLCYQAINDQLTATIRTNADLTETFDLALAGMTRAIRASRGMVLLLKDAATTQVIVASDYPQACPFPEVGFDEDLETLEQDHGTWVNYSFPAEECSLCQALLTQTSEGLTFSALTASEESPPTPLAPIFQLENLSSLLLMPISHQGGVMGFLVLQNCELREWAAEEQSFVKLVAAQLSTAIIQSQSLQHIQSVVNERTAQLQRSLEVQAKLYEKTRQQLEQLRKLDEEREEFLSTVSHELLTPLTSMGLAVRMLRQAKLTPDRQARYLDILEQQCQQETQLINDMLALRQLETNPTIAQFHPVDLRSLIQEVAQADSARWQKKGLKLRLDLPSSLTLRSDLDSLKRILIELLNNARKYADPHSQVHLKAVEVKPPSPAIVLAIQSTGLGIQPEEIEQIFNKFKRGEGAAHQAIQGTGLGLTLVKRLVEHVKGAIAVTSQPDPSGKSWQTCFTLTFPAGRN